MDGKERVAIELIRFLRFAIVALILYVVVFNRPTNVACSITTGVVIGLSLASVYFATIVLKKIEE